MPFKYLKTRVYVCVAVGLHRTHTCTLFLVRCQRTYCTCVLNTFTSKRSNRITSTFKDQPLCNFLQGFSFTFKLGSEIIILSVSRTRAPPSQSLFCGWLVFAVFGRTNRFIPVQTVCHRVFNISDIHYETHSELTFFFPPRTVLPVSHLFRCGPVITDYRCSRTHVISSIFKISHEIALSQSRRMTTAFYCRNYVYLCRYRKWQKWNL